MSEKPDKRILEIVRRYLQLLRDNNYKFESAWLFGSCATGNPDSDSDIDIAIIMPEIKEKFYKELELTKYRRKIDFRIEPHIISDEDKDMPLYKDIIERGIKIAQV